MSVPFVILGDGWQNPTGLARIARDLATILEPLVEPYYIGYHPPALVIAPGPARWHSFSHLGDDWGASTVIERLSKQFNPDVPGVLLVVWDPARAYYYLQLKEYLPAWQLWGYFAVDGHNVHGSIGGGAAHAIRTFDRVLAYTEYGMGVLRKIRGRPVAALPHGHSVEPPVFDPTALHRLIPRYAADPTAWVLGCVATNQPRKDLHLFMQVIAALRKQGEHVYGWLHTDELVKHWSVPELVDIHDVARWIRVTTAQLTDQQLWQYYRGCTMTLCVGRGEGFGYPTVESLACGTPAVGMDYAGGAEIIPVRWRYGWQGVDYSWNQYAIGRPLGSLELVLGALGRAAQDTREQGYRGIVAHCQGTVAHLDWRRLTPRWESWVRQGMENL